MRTKLVIAILVGASLSGCDVVTAISNGVLSPITPAQSRAQVLAAARELVGVLHLPVVEAYFWHAACHDEGGGPFRGAMRIAYPLAPSFEASDAEVAKMVAALQRVGWSGDPNFHSHGSVLKKHDVTVDFAPQNVGTPTRDVELLGECRDVTTNKGDSQTEAITFN